MSENIVIYAGTNEVGKLKKKAIEREAKRMTQGSVSVLVWTLLRRYGSAKLKEDLEAADKRRVALR